MLEQKTEILTPAEVEVVLQPDMYVMADSAKFLPEFAREAVIYTMQTNCWRRVVMFQLKLQKKNVLQEMINFLMKRKNRKFPTLPYCIKQELAWHKLLSLYR